LKKIIGYMMLAPVALGVVVGAGSTLCIIIMEDPYFAVGLITAMAAVVTLVAWIALAIHLVENG